MKRRTFLSLVGTGAVVLGTAVAGVAQATSASAATLSSNWYASAPYLMPFDNSPPDPVEVMNATGQKAFQLAFILAPNGGGCTPTWDGTRAVSSDSDAASMISRIRANGGDVSVSIGGYGGTKLGQTCGTPEATAAAYQQVVSKYALKAIDFDLEEPEYENTAAVHNEVGAAKILQQNNAGLYVSITTAGTAAGTGWFGTQMLLDAKSQGFTPANYSIMPFDGGFNGGGSQTAALDAFHTLLMNTFGWDSATAFAHEGISQMNGRSDAGEYFRQADFQTTLDYATSHHLARYTNWSVNRDRQCADPNQSTTSGTCSSVPQSLYEFTKYSARFAGVSTPNPPASGSRIISNFNGRCLDVPGFNYTDGQQADLWDCNNGANQNWDFTAGTVRTQNNKCLDVTGNGTANGTPIEIWTCNGGANQQFVLNAAGDLVNPQANKCVDIPGFANTNGAALDLWDCNGGSNQKWHQG